MKRLSSTKVTQRVRDGLAWGKTGGRDSSQEVSVTVLERSHTSDQGHGQAGPGPLSTYERQSAGFCY